ncbi:isocitrate dehydrogenase (NAD(+)) idh1 [Datura stramonium]|uniref:Isocitrate dehydrogenase (NAD(+)) idh1 n=1 Tax=Datura stramonium TaxID=4076 RepID=A0ABS8SYQ3_DATST|nr:isocitrate dehydrogenase (NAD(+)) idh1 [Datura stramonium]
MENLPDLWMYPKSYDKSRIKASSWHLDVIGGVKMILSVKRLETGPEYFEFAVTPNLYGNLVANTATGIAGSTGLNSFKIWSRPKWINEFVTLLRNGHLVSGNVGADHAVFEQGASAGNVGNKKIMEQKKANPVALLLSSAMMLRHLQID